MVQCNALWYGTAQLCMIRYNTMLYNTVQRNFVQYGTAQCYIIWYNPMFYDMVQHNFVHHGQTQCCMTWYSAMLYDMVQHNVVLYGRRQCCTTWYSAMLYDMVERRRTCGKEWVESTQMPLGIHQRAGHYRHYPLDNSFLISTYKYHWTHAQSQKCLYISNQRNRLTHYHRLKNFNQKCQSQQEVRVQGVPTKRLVSLNMSCHHHHQQSQQCHNALTILRPMKAITIMSNFLFVMIPNMIAWRKNWGYDESGKN